MENDIKKILKKLEEHDTSFDSLTTEIHKGFEGTAESITAVMTMSTDRFSKLDRSVSYWTQQVDELRDRLRVLETTVEKLQKSLS